MIASPAAFSNASAFAFAVGAGLPDDDFALAEMLYSEERDLDEQDQSPHHGQTRRRFQRRGKTTFFGLDNALYRPIGGRFGGEAGNRKRRAASRRDDSIEHSRRVRSAEQALRQQIEEELCDRRDAQQPVGNKRRSSGRGRGASRQAASAPVTEVKAPISKRAAVKRSMRSISRERLTNAQIRARLGLAPKS